MFNVEKEVNGITNFIRDYFDKNNIYGAVLGISGGKDSAVVAALFSKALGSKRVVGLTLPCHSKIDDKNGAKVVSDYYGFKLLNIDLTNTFDAFKEEFNSNFDNVNSDNTKNSDINLKPRLRMASVYYVASHLSALQNKTYIVAGTSNASEIYVGYFTKGGDNVHDISVLGNLTVDEVIKVGEYLNVPKEILYKTPSDGLSDLSDEEKLGVTYKDIAKVINNEYVETPIKEKIKTLHNRNAHKFNIPTYKKEVNYDTNKQ